MSRYWQILKQAAEKWLDDKAPQLGAALAFYSLLSLGPLLLISVSIAGLIFGEEAARGQIVSQIDGLIGKAGAEVVQALLANTREESTGIIATIIGLVTLLIGASGVFAQLQEALNIVWKATPPKRPIWAAIKNRFLSFTMVLGIGFLLLVSLLLSTVLNALGAFFAGNLPSLAPFLEIVNFVVTFGVVTLLFAMMFKILPDIQIPWKNVWSGAALSAGLFTIGKFLIGLYLGQSTIASTYGAAGSFLVLALWVYYSAQILIFGAELTYIVSNKFHQHQIKHTTLPQ